MQPDGVHFYISNLYFLIEQNSQFKISKVCDIEVFSDWDKKIRLCGKWSIPSGQIIMALFQIPFKNLNTVIFPPKYINEMKNRLHYVIIRLKSRVKLIETVMSVHFSDK